MVNLRTGMEVGDKRERKPSGARRRFIVHGVSGSKRVVVHDAIRLTASRGRMYPSGHGLD